MWTKITQEQFNVITLSRESTYHKNHLPKTGGTMFWSRVYCEFSNTFVDVDECLTGRSSCQQICKNTIGGYECGCFHGFKSVDKFKCECKLSAFCESKMFAMRLRVYRLRIWHVNGIDGPNYNRWCLCHSELQHPTSCWIHIYNRLLRISARSCAQSFIPTTCVARNIC